MSGAWKRIPNVLLVLALAASVACAPGRDTSYEITADFDRAFNLFEGSRVRVLGVAVGTVEEITFEPGMDTVRTRLRIDGDVRLPAGASAQIVFASMLGERHVEISPPYTGGDVLEAGGHIAAERTSVPAEFDEILESLNDFLEGLPPDEVARLVSNAAEVVHGRGSEIGETLEDLAVAVDVLRDNDESIVSLARRLADLNATLSTRDAEIGRMIEDWNVVVSTLAAERDVLDSALDGIARMSGELGDLLATHRDNVEADVRTVTRLGRTAERNLDELDLLLLGQSELYRHAERVFDFERNWLPLVNHSEDLGRLVADRLTSRLVDVCTRLGFTECADPEFWSNGMPTRVCFSPVALCADDPRRPPPPEGTPEEELPVPLGDALRTAVELVPELPEGLATLRERERFDAQLEASLPLPGVPR